MTKPSHDTLEKIARELIRDALRGVLRDVKVSDDVRKRLTLGAFFDPGERVFELYLPGDTPTDAIVVAEARVSETTLRGTVEVFEERLRQIIDGRC